MSQDIIFKVENLRKSFDVGIGERIEVLKGINFEIKRGEFVIIFGPSGCGKSTLFNILIGLEEPTKGNVIFLGRDIYKMSEDERADLREKEIGMLYQQPVWISALNVLENVAFPLILHGVSRGRAIPLALSYLAQNRMETWKDFNPKELSGGQQQKVGLSRATVTNAPVLIADEPTGNLDRESAVELMNLLLRQSISFGRTTVMATHDISFLDYADRVLRIVDGIIGAEYRTSEEKKKLYQEIIESKLPLRSKL